MTTRKRQSGPLTKHFAPHAYQKKAMRFLAEHGAAGLFLDPGLGKTAIVLSTLKALIKGGITKGALVIAPLRVCYSVWPKEVEKWEDFNDLKVVILHGKHMEANLREDADIYVINPDGLKWLCDNGGKIQCLLNKGVDTLVVDELSKFKHSKTKRFKSLKKWLPRFRRRWGLTGSPASNGLLDLFGQCYVLDLGRALGPYITHYRMQYFYQTGYGGYTWTPMHGAAEKIYERLRPLVLRMAAGDYLELPERIDNIIKVDLPENARRVYDEMEEHAFAVIDAEQRVTAASAAAAMIKCSQVANGGVYLDRAISPETMGQLQKRETQELHSAKTDALVDLVEELQGAPLLVAYEFQHDIERILKAIPGTPYIGGGVSPKRAAELETLWNAGKVPVLLGHPASIGHGLNLQGEGMANVGWFGIPWDLELYDQFIRRVLRQGNTAKHVMVHHIVARNTVDEAKLKALHRKERNQNALLTALNDYRKETAK